MSSKKSVFVCIVALLLATVLGITPSAAQQPSEGENQVPAPTAGGEAYSAPASLPLGNPDLVESRDSSTVAPGVTYTRIERGEESDDDFYTVDAALVATMEEAQGVADQLSGDGYEPRIETISERPPDAPGSGPLAYLVRVGSFPSKEEAEELQAQLEEAGYGGEQGDAAYKTPKVAYTGEDGGETAGPWVVNILEVAPNGFGGSIAPALATGVVPEKETLTSIASRAGVPATVNGGYFVVEPEDGTPGDLAGISAVDGRLVSEAINGRTSLLLSGEAGSVASLSSQQVADAPDGARRTIDGFNRRPGLIRNCGGVGGDEPTEFPKHDFTCTDESELVLFTPEFGQESEPGDGAEVVLNPSGEVVEARDERGGEIPPGGAVLSGTGDAAEWLRVHVRQGARISISADVYADGEPLPLGDGLGIVNGRPRLLRDGEVEISARAEGFTREEDSGFYYAFGVRRNPRTLAGIKPDGTLLLVTVDGRGPGYSVGASFEESARLMQALGAAQALNLDGGGSTTMTLGEELVNRPSDDTGERPIGDAVLIPEGGGLPQTGGLPLAPSTPVPSGHVPEQEVAQVAFARWVDRDAGIHPARTEPYKALVATLEPGLRQRDGAADHP